MILFRELPRRHKNLYHTLSRDEFERAVAQLAAAIPSLQDHQIIVRVIEIAAKVGDGHTYVHLPPTFRRYPLGLRWFGNDLRVTAGAKEYCDVLGSRVVKVGGIAVQDVQARVLTLLPQGENEWFLLNNSPNMMLCPEVLEAVGVAPDVGPTPFTLQIDDGRESTLVISPIALAPDAGGVVRLDLQSAARSEPLSRQKPTEPFWFRYLLDSQTVYVSFRGYDAHDCPEAPQDEGTLTDPARQPAGRKR